VIRGKGIFSSQLLRAVEEVNSVTAQDRSAVVLVWVGSNDLWELYSGKPEVTAETEEQDAMRFSENVRLILFELRNAGAEVIIATLDDQSKRPARTRHEVYPDITAEELKRMSAQVTRYNEIILEKAEEHNALSVDFYGSEIFVQNETLSTDGYHPSSQGYDQIYKEWYKVLVKLLP
jgi:lysophospholipase L1-like esterase